MAFPSSPTNNQVYNRFGIDYIYSSDTGRWKPLPTISRSTLASSSVSALGGIDITSTPPTSGQSLFWNSANSKFEPGSAGLGTQIYANVVDLPASGSAPGIQAYVTENNTLYIWNGTGWYTIALINQSPTITTGSNASYTLDNGGTPTIIQLAATDPEEVPITWSYTVTSGALEDTTVAVSGNTFTVTPGTVSATFDLTFTASDGINIDTSVSSFTLSFGPVLMQTIDNPDPYISGTGSDFFGRCININGDKVLVGAPWEDDAGGDLSGKAYVFNVTNGSLLYTLNNPNSYGTSTQDFFGDEQGVAINSTRYWVSSWYNQASDGVTRAGTVYGFNLTGSLTNTINAPSGILSFGKVIAASDNYLVIGAPDNNDPSSQTGKAFIYNSSGSLLYTLTNPSIYSTTYDTFGFSVDVNGNYVIVSSPGSKKDASLAYLGRVYIYDATTGTLVKTLDNPNPETSSGFDQFGYVVRLSGNYAVVTSYSEDVGFTNSGIAYVYKTTNGTWSDATLLYTIYNPTASNPTPESSFGQHLDVNSDTIFVTTGTKTLWAFNLIDGSPKYDLKLPAEVVINSVSATDTHIAMGSISPGSTVGKGQAFIYEF